MKEKSCAFTGYRPEKFSFGYDEQHPDCEQIKQRLFCEALRLTREGVSVFISGASLGVDIWAAEAVLLIKNTFPSRNIKLWLAIPFDRQAASWSEADRKRYDELLQRADRVEYVSHDFFPGCYQKRNRWLVDNAGHLIAVYDGQPGGTQYTVNYAQRKGLEITIIDPKDKEADANGTVH